MLKKLTKEEAEKIISEYEIDKQVVIFNEKDKQWYDIRGLSMEEVGKELMKMAERGIFNKQK